jgi:hypothetical protein
MKTKLNRQEVKDANYTAANAADAEIKTAHDAIWTATGNYIEYADTTSALDKAESALKAALKNVAAIRAAIAAEVAQ